MITAAPVPTPAAGATQPPSSSPPASSSGPTVGFLKFGPGGLVVSSDTGEALLFEGDVFRASGDGAGGLLFATDGPGGRQEYWLPRGMAIPIPIELHIFITGFGLDGRPAVLSIEPAPADCASTYWGEGLMVTDLDSGQRTLLFCDSSGPDGGPSITSVGGRFLSVVASEHWEVWTAHGMRLVDFTGEPVSLVVDPIPSPCEPCEVDAMLSRDGTLLAYRYRPDAYWPQERVRDISPQQWWVATQAVVGTIGVLDLGTGELVFRMDAPAGDRIVDFDGVHLVVASTPALTGATDRSFIIDITGHAPVQTIDGDWTVALLP